MSLKLFPLPSETESDVNSTHTKREAELSFWLTVNGDPQYANIPLSIEGESVLSPFNICEEKLINQGKNLMIGIYDVNIFFFFI